MGDKKPERIFQYPVTVAAFRRYTQDKTRYRTRAELNGFSYRFGNPTAENQLNLTCEVGREEKRREENSI